MTTTHNRTQLVQAVARRANVALYVADHVVDAMIEKIDELTDMGPLTIRGFGRFEKRTAPERLARNPRTGETMQVPARTRLAFKAATPRG